MNPDDFIEHPEGGRFLEVFRSPQLVTTTNITARSAVTHIYFALEPGEVSRFHRMQSDEVWNLYRGDGVKLYVWEGTKKPPETVTLMATDNAFCHVVPAGAWQAAEPLGSSVLVGCTVAPGFDFADFELLDPRSEQAGALKAMDPELARFVDS